MQQTQQQPTTQVPPVQSQVPDPRLAAIMENQRILEAQNAQLRAQVDALARGNNKPPEKKESPFKPEVQDAINTAIKEALAPVQEQFRHQVGFLTDRNDELQFQLKYGGDRYKDYLPKVEQIRKEFEVRGQWIPREEALRKVYFDETSSKPQPDPAQVPQQAQPKAPVYDPYFQTMVDPDTRMPVAQQPAPAQQAQEQVPNWQQPPPPQQPNQQGQYHQPNLQTQQPIPQGFGLPNQGVNTPAQQRTERVDARKISLDLNSSEADLAAFESQLGDIPL